MRQKRLLRVSGLIVLFLWGGAAAGVEFRSVWRRARAKQWCPEEVLLIIERPGNEEKRGFLGELLLQSDSYRENSEATHRIAARALWEMRRWDFLYHGFGIYRGGSWYDYPPITLDGTVTITDRREGVVYAGTSYEALFYCPLGPTPLMVRVPLALGLAYIYQAFKRSMINHELHSTYVEASPPLVLQVASSIQLNLECGYLVFGGHIEALGLFGGFSDLAPSGMQFRLGAVVGGRFPRKTKRPDSDLGNVAQ